MSDSERNPNERPASPSPGSDAPPRPDRVTPVKEIGGRDGPDPVRYGDWEKGGRCIDF
ncbi:Hypothetical protein I596_3157 [Dokdonella koreensis DS-123]|uniref:DUF1674 domain-containing protein n=2 Tax=Dokdonella TaxID=323413 RepID=A0A160DWV9_9GAMM|nr:DUF1674 domain-containing protein [Dokdonella koreensis]ANB19147.1 Hypothetical protein I596_3157 [Dokdonella koreensis DS-123]